MFKSLIILLFSLSCGLTLCNDRYRLTDSEIASNCITQAYLSQVGVREATGHNDGAEVEQYLASTGLDKGYAWCAAFVSWSYQQCGIKAAKSAWSPSWFPPDKVIWKQGKGGRDPTAGDVFGIWFNSKKRIAHVGFIHKWGDQFVITVEGNTNTAGSREGDGVYKKRRLKRQIYMVSRWVGG